MLDAEDVTLPELELEPEPELGLEFGVVLVLVSGSELSLEAVTWPEISERKKTDVAEHLIRR